ncbi:MAG: suppressor of fused domain protein [Planctomycetes bacterium]|nr:suppressor of fused domain protein [Planctomycetota bacterium]
MAADEFAKWFEALWCDREDRAYQALFGDLGQGVYTASPQVYAQFGKQPHPGWLNHGVFACPPHGERTGWLYVTSGLSNPWNLTAPGRDASGFSGLGFELTIETSAPVTWAVPLLHNLMAYELLVAIGSYADAELLEYGQRVPLNASIAPGEQSVVRWLLVEPPKHFAPHFELAAGRVDLFHLVGASDAEIEFARQTSNEMLVALLQKEGVYPRTDAGRRSCR